MQISLLPLQFFPLNLSVFFRSSIRYLSTEILKEFLKLYQEKNLSEYIEYHCFFILSKSHSFSRFFKTEYLNHFTAYTHCVGDNIDLSLNSNISNRVRVNISFTSMFFKKYSISFLMISRLIGFVLVVIQLLMFKVCGIVRTSKIEFLNFSDIERFKQDQKR